MAHTRERQVEQLFSRLIHFSPIVGVFGHRQVGKTTYAAQKAGSYWTLDDRNTREKIKENPKKFVSQKQARPVIIDECQLEPDLFPALKEHVRSHKQPGQFILSGSVRFSSRRAIRESLAGRIVSLELFPLILSEIDQRPLPEILPQLIETKFFSENSLSLLNPHKEVLSIIKSLKKYLQNGGLPGLCFIRENRLRQEALSALHQLILDRDLRLVLETKLSLQTLNEFLKQIAKNGWNPYNASSIRRTIGLAPQTQKNLLYAFESMFLIRRIPIIGRAGEIFLLEDQFEEYFLSDAQHTQADQLLSAFYRNSRAQFFYRLGDSTRFESYWTRSGARIPLVIKNSFGALGFIVFSGDQPTLSQKRSAESFLRHEPDGKIIFLSDQLIKPKIIESRILICSPASVL